MDKREGYFISVKGMYRDKNEEAWFGPRVDDGLAGQSFESLTSKNITLFPTDADARASLPQIEARANVTEPTIVYMALDIAENEEEVRQLHYSENVVLLNTTDIGVDMIGPNMTDNDKTTIYPIEGELMRVNGRTPFPTFPKWIHHETGRQGGRVGASVLR